MLEIGVRGPDDEFQALADGDTARLEIGIGGSLWVEVGLRAQGIDPHEPDPSVVANVAGILAARGIEGRPRDMFSDDTAYVLWDLWLTFHFHPCCFVCRDGVIEAQLVDASGRTFEGEVTVRLARDVCPDTGACCESADYCPDPSLTQLCK